LAGTEDVGQTCRQSEGNEEQFVAVAIHALEIIFMLRGLAEPQLSLSQEEWEVAVCSLRDSDLQC